MYLIFYKLDQRKKEGRENHLLDQKYISLWEYSKIILVCNSKDASHPHRSPLYWLTPRKLREKYKLEFGHVQIH